MIYLDTSVLGAVFSRESNASTVFRQISAGRPSGLMVSTWTRTEFASVGGIKERTGVIDRDERLRATALFDRLVAERFHLFDVERSDFTSAARLLAGAYPLRAGDPLHLAIANRLGAMIATLDQRMRTAALGFGIGIFPVG